jgi:hypothetical protein
MHRRALNSRHSYRSFAARIDRLGISADECGGQNDDCRDQDNVHSMLSVPTSQFVVNVTFER